MYHKIKPTFFADKKLLQNIYNVPSWSQEINEDAKYNEHKYPAFILSDPIFLTETPEYVYATQKVCDSSHDVNLQCSSHSKSMQNSYQTRPSFISWVLFLDSFSVFKNMAIFTNNHQDILKITFYYSNKLTFIQYCISSRCTTQWLDIYIT